jgi:hypothetical protein
MAKWCRITFRTHVLAVCDSYFQESFDHVNDWLSEVNRYASEGTCKLLVGNKSDRPDKSVSTSTAKASKGLNMIRITCDFTLVCAKTYADCLQIPFLETSAKSAANVEAAFLTMTSELIKMRYAACEYDCVTKVPNVLFAERHGDQKKRTLFLSDRGPSHPEGAAAATSVLSVVPCRLNARELPAIACARCKSVVGSVVTGV